MPRSKEQFQKIKDARENQILESALYFFALRGYDGVSGDDITKNVGCSHGLLYHYFKSKEELFDCLLQRVIKVKYLEIIKDVDIKQKPKFFVQDLLDAYINALNSPRTDYACTIYLVLNLHLQKKVLPKICINNKNNSIFSCLFQAIEEGKKTGEFCDNDTKEMTIAILSCLKGLSYTRIMLGYKNSVLTKSEILMRMIVKK